MRRPAQAVQRRRCQSPRPQDPLRPFRRGDRFQFPDRQGTGLRRYQPGAFGGHGQAARAFADKHKIWIGFHNHTNNYPAIDKWDPILDHSPYIGFNLDIGHYFAGTKGKSPLPMLEKYHDRIVSLHLKDRTVDGQNLPWGTGQTPIKEVLQLMKKEKWTFPADIEVEYKIPAGSSCRGRGGQVCPVLQRGPHLNPFSAAAQPDAAGASRALTTINHRRRDRQDGLVAQSDRPNLEVRTRRTATALSNRTSKA